VDDWQTKIFALFVAAGKIDQQTANRMRSFRRGYDSSGAERQPSNNRQREGR
jgi:hypothetical protein